jgi:cellulose synthase (UDP-forming)
MKKRLEGFKNRAWLIFNIGWTIIYLIWRTLYTVPLHDGIISAVAGISLLVVEIVGMFEAFVHYFNMHRIENHPVPVVPLEEYPDVDVFIATYNEPTELLYKTINGCVHMDYPDKSKVHIYICDDGRRAEVRQLAEQMHVNYLDREDNKGAKAGNLNHALSVTSSPLIATFDADMIPQHEFLLDTVAYFVDQEIKNRELEEKDRIKIGFIQTPQSFYNPDLFQFNLFSESRIPNEQDYFYKDVQVARNKSNCVIYGGSNTVISREALNDVGGFFTKSITEDFATGIKIQQKGYICYAINKVLASGLSPTDLKSLINQRIRWGRGCIQTGRRVHICLSRHLSLAQKANYLASIWYWYASWKRLIYIMSPILFATFGVLVVKCSLIEVLIFWLPMYISSNISLKMMSRNIRTTKWTNLYETTIFPFMMIPVLLETFGISMKKFKVTQKDAKQNKKKDWVYAIPHTILIILSVIGIANCIRWTFTTGRIDYFVILFWLFVNLFNLVMSLFFVMGRNAVRKNERQVAEIPCTITARYGSYKGVTRDISEGGVAVIIPYAFDVDEEETCGIQLDSDRYHAAIEGKIVSVTKTKQGWCYVFGVTGLKDSRQDFLQLIYDREPSLPDNLDESLSSFDDLRLNITRRVVKSDFQNRKKARIPVMKNFTTNMGDKVKMINFNYQFALFELGVFAPDHFTIELEKGLTIRLKKNRIIGEQDVLYRVENYQEIYDNKELYEKMENWANTMAAEFEKETDHLVKKKTAVRKKKSMIPEDEFYEMNYL